MGQFFSLKNSKFFSGLKKNWPIVASVTTDTVLLSFQNRIRILKNHYMHLPHKTFTYLDLYQHYMTFWLLQRRQIRTGQTQT